MKRSRTTQPDRLGTLAICGVRVPVLRATPAEEPELTNTDGSANLGFFCGERNVIVVREGQSPSAERDAINHEAVHAFVTLSGLGALLAGVVVWPKGYDDFEEVLARLAAPHLGNRVTSQVRS